MLSGFGSFDGDAVAEGCDLWYSSLNVGDRFATMIPRREPAIVVIMCWYLLSMRRVYFFEGRFSQFCRSCPIAMVVRTISVRQ
jgi:hypothetical protein